MMQAGTRLGGKYRVVGLLGEGSMGTVYECEHMRISRRVAVKVLHRQFSRNERAVGRFIREARAAGAVGHPNIVEATDFGSHHGQPFIVMELLRGEDLAQRLGRDHRIDSRAACAIVAQILSALASTHAAGIVHRDLKPENIYLTRRTNGPDVVKILDFGLSKFRRSDGETRLQTQEGVIMGTPAYMAPEQWMGSRDIDHRADLFSVGVVLYECLTGKLPYVGETQGELFQEIVNGTRESLSPAALIDDLPAGLDEVVMKAIHRKRDERFATSQAFLDSLRPFGAGDIIAVGDPPASAPLDDSDDTLRVLRSTHGDAGSRRVGLRATLGATLVAAAVAGVVLFASARARRSEVPAMTSRARTAAALDREVAPPLAPPVARLEEPGEVRIDLRGLPAGAVVRLDGILQEGPVLAVAREDRSRTIEVQNGNTRTSIPIRPDHDQVVVVGPSTPDPAARRANGNGGAGSTGPADAVNARRRANGRTGRGIGSMSVSHEF